MLVQRATFTIHDVLHPLDKQDVGKNCLLKSTIPAKANDTLRSDLAALGIDPAALFPDLEWMSQGLAESELPPPSGNW